MLQKQDQLKEALKESEKRARELAEFSSSVENLQRWMEQHKHLGQAPLEGATEATGMSTETEKLQKVCPALVVVLHGEITSSNEEQMITGYPTVGAMGRSGDGRARKFSDVCLHINAIVARSILVTNIALWDTRTASAPSILLVLLEPH